MIDKIELNELRPEIIRFLNYQIDLTDVETAEEVDLNFIKEPEALMPQIEEALSLASQFDVELITFPELSIPSKLLNVLIEYSKINSTIIIGGSHYFEKDGKIYNRSPIIINGEVHFTYKNIPALIEKSPVPFGNFLTRGDKFLSFRNSKIGNFIVVICADYLDPDTRSAILNEKPDIIIVIALQPDSKKYFMHFQADCHDSREGIYFIY